MLPMNKQVTQETSGYLKALLCIHEFQSCNKWRNTEELKNSKHVKFRSTLDALGVIQL